MYTKLQQISFALIACFGATVSSHSYADVEVRYTPWNSDGGGSSLYLDRHFLDCYTGSTPRLLNGFQLETQVGGSMRYRYTCTSINKNPSSYTWNATPLNDDGSGNTIYLDRHTIECSDRPVISFRLVSFPNHLMSFGYGCTGDKFVYTGDDYYTEWSAEGYGRVMYLDRQHVMCPNNGAMSSLRLQRSGADTYRYAFKCHVPDIR
jgi:hypothetical protein